MSSTSLTRLPSAMVNGGEWVRGQSTHGESSFYTLRVTNPDSVFIAIGLPDILYYILIAMNQCYSFFSIADRHYFLVGQVCVSRRGERVLRAGFGENWVLECRKLAFKWY